MGFGHMGFIFVTIVLWTSCFVPTECFPDRNRTSQFPYHVDMDYEGKYILRWNFNDTHIFFEAQVETTGWVALGISESKKMVPADIYLGHVDMVNGTVPSGDYYTEGYFKPSKDIVQNWVTDHGYEEDGWTVLAFHRLLDTCDSQDQAITKHTTSLIWAYGPGEPPGEPNKADGDHFVGMSKHRFKGQKGVELLTLPRPPLTLPADSLTADFLTNNFSIPANERTTFRCRVFDLTPDPQQPREPPQKYHIIKMSPILSTATEANVGHMTLYRCYHPAPENLTVAGDSFDCFTDAPNSLQFCREHVASFGHGKHDFFLPQDVGIPLVVGGIDKEPNVYVLAVKYENEIGTQNLVDNSGIRITYTSELRQHEAGFLSVGNIISPNWVQFLPPGQANFEQRAYCSMKCLAWGKDDCSNKSTTASAPMTVAGVQFHTHGLGRTMKLRHLTYVNKRQTRENPWIAYDKTYDPDEQSFRVIKERRSLRCWDELMLECGYDTRQQTGATYGGWTDYDELCRAYVLYYPIRRIEGCMSWSNYDQLVDTNNRKVPAAGVFQTLSQVPWGNPSVSQRMTANLKRSLETSYENGQCWSSRRDVGYATDYFKQPRVLNRVSEEPSSACRV